MSFGLRLMQPNLDIPIFVVAPDARWRDKVLKGVNRPSPRKPAGTFLTPYERGPRSTPIHFSYPFPIRCKKNSSWSAAALTSSRRKA